MYIAVLPAAKSYIEEVTYMRYSKEQIIQNIKDCGQSLIDNAEKITNDYKYTDNSETVITCYPNDYDRGPFIRVETVFAPEKFIERL